MPNSAPSNLPPAAPPLSALAREIGKKRPFEVPEQEALLNLVRTASVLQGPFEVLLRERGLSGAGYNILRILRGAGDEGRACHEIGCQMVARVPDVTRLVDRLEAAGLVERRRSAADRRVVMVAITGPGLELLGSLDEPMTRLHREGLGHLSASELEELNRLLVRARSAHSGAAAG